MLLHFLNGFRQGLWHLNVLYNTKEEIFNTFSSRCRCLAETNPIFFSLNLTLPPRYFHLFLQVFFIANQNANGISSVMLFEELQPHVNTFKSFFSGNVVDKDCTVGVSDVIGDQWFEFLLACCVPQLKAVERAFVMYIFDKEIDSDCMLRWLSRYGFDRIESILNKSFDEGWLPYRNGS